jgi:TonB-linked SusC/RagA family outer membrane protein
MMEFYKRLFSFFGLAKSRPNTKAKYYLALAKAVPMLLILIGSVLGAAAQSPRKVSGKVVDDQNLPVIGAGVKIKGSTTATTTDVNGSYQISALPSDVLQFTFIGYTAQERTVGNNSTINVTIPLEVSSLNEVVVVGYGTQKKANLTGAVTTVKVDEVLGNRPVSTTGALLQGVVPGLKVNIGSGAPGASKSLNIRGATDISATGGSDINSSAPLVLVDNVPFNGPLNLLDPNDIESVSVLKDAGSAAIYGARSAFGVILITTKKGNKNQAPKLNYSNNLTISTPSELPQKATVLQTIQSYKDMGTTGYVGGQDVDTWLDLYKQYQANPAAYPLGYAMINSVRYPLATTDNIKDLLGDNAKQYMHNFSVSGGADKTTYRFSAGTVSENGIIVPDSKQDFYKRYNLKSFITTDVRKWLTVQLDAAFFSSNKSYPSRPGFANAASYAPYTPTDDSLEVNGITYINGSPRMLVQETNANTTRIDDTRLTGRILASPLAGLKITGEYTFDNLRSLGTEYSKVLTAVNTRRYSVETSGDGTFGKTHEKTDYTALNLFANYDKSFGNHNFSLMTGYNQEESLAEVEALSRDGVISANYPSISQAAGTLITIDDGYSEYAVQGAFGRLNYNYKEKYLLSFTGRVDASSRFPKGHRSGFFPSFSAGWSLDKESFMEWSSGWLNQFKPRFGFGSVGNQNIGLYQFLPTMNATIPSWLVGQSQVVSLSTPGLISSDFTWANIQTTNIGLDIAVLKNRLSANFDWFKRETKDLLYEGIQLPAALGTDAPLQNVAALASRGFELQVNWQDKIGKVSYRLAGNLADFRSKITDIKNEAGLLSQYYVGQELGEIWGYTTDRLFTVDDFVPGTLDANLRGGTLKPGIAAREGQLPNPGDVKFADLNDDGIVNAGNSTLSNLGDRRIIGNDAPRYQYGLLGGVTWKNLDFSFNITGVAKQDIWRANMLTFPNYYAFGTIYAHQLNYWSPSNQNSFWGRTYDQAGGNQSTNESIQTKYMLNGAHLRVRNLTLAYTLPKRITEKVLIDRFQTFFSIENAFTFDKLPKGLDPDITANGQQGYEYPFMRLYSLGVNLSF